MKRRQVLEQLRQERAERKKQKQGKRRAQPTHDPAHDETASDEAVIGWLASDGERRVMPEGVVFVSGIKDRIRDAIDSRDRDGRVWAEPITAAQVFAELAEGTTFALDDRAYNKFWPLARDAGLPYGPVGGNTVDDNRFHLLKGLNRNPTRTPPRIVGWFARRGLHSLCDGDALMVAGSEAKMREIAAHFGGTWQFQSTTSAELLAGLRQGAAYAFEETAYNGFLPFAREAGLRLAPQDFSDPGPHGMHFVRIQLR